VGMRRCFNRGSSLSLSKSDPHPNLPGEREGTGGEHLSRSKTLAMDAGGSATHGAVAEVGRATHPCIPRLAWATNIPSRNTSMCSTSAAAGETSTSADPIRSFEELQTWQAHGSASPRYGRSSSVAGRYVGLLHRSPVWRRRVVGDRASAANAVRWLCSFCGVPRNAELSSGLRERGSSAYPRRTFLLPIYRIRQIRPSFESMTWRVPSLSVASPMGRYAALAG
jgi:hypothetical protein